MYKAIGVGLFSLFLLMVIPSSLETQQDEAMMYGMATITQRDAIGDVISENTVHNRLVNTGETFLLQQAFRDTVLQGTDANTVSTICLYSFVAD